MDTRQQQVAKNEALFREVNERIEKINARLGAVTGGDFLCECGDAGCTQPIEMNLAEYEAVRSTPTHFAISPGHREIDVENVIEQNERYWVVEKLPGAPAAIAISRDPRG